MGGGEEELKKEDFKFKIEEDKKHPPAFRIRGGSVLSIREGGEDWN